MVDDIDYRMNSNFTNHNYDHDHKLISNHYYESTYEFILSDQI